MRLNERLCAPDQCCRRKDGLGGGSFDYADWRNVDRRFGVEMAAQQGIHLLCGSQPHLHVPGKDVYFFRSGGRPGLHPTADARITVEECIVVFDSVETAKDDAESYVTGAFELVIPDGETTISSKDGRFDVGDHAQFIPQDLILEYQFVIKTDTDV